MKKCEHFTNGRCAYECPNISIDSWEDHFELDAKRELGIERVICRECRFFDDNCTCDDCYFKFSKDCPNNESGE